MAAVRAEQTMPKSVPNSMTGMTGTSRVAIRVSRLGRTVLVEKGIDVGRVVEPIMVEDLCGG